MQAWSRAGMPVARKKKRGTPIQGVPSFLLLAGSFEMDMVEQQAGQFRRAITTKFFGILGYPYATLLLRNI